VEHTEALQVAADKAAAAAATAAQNAAQSTSAREEALLKKLGAAVAETRRLQSNMEELQEQMACNNSSNGIGGNDSSSSSLKSGTPAQRMRSGVEGGGGELSPVGMNGSSTPITDIESGGGSGSNNDCSNGAVQPYSPSKGSYREKEGVVGVHPTVVHLWALMRTHLPCAANIVGERPPRIGRFGKGFILYVLLLHLLLWIYMGRSCDTRALVGQAVGAGIKEVMSAAQRPLPPH
jgi:hypothetical protein